MAFDDEASACIEASLRLQALVRVNAICTTALISGSEVTPEMPVPTLSNPDGDGTHPRWPRSMGTVWSVLQE